MKFRNILLWAELTNWEKKKGNLFREENKIGPPYQLLTFLIMEILFFHVQNSLSNTEWQSVRKCTLLKFQYNNMFLKLCSNFVWFLMFHRVLTWEDAYYENCEQHDPLENKCFSETLENSCSGRYPHDLLGLAVAKMSYHVYSLGEGYGLIHEWTCYFFFFPPLFIMQFLENRRCLNFHLCLPNYLFRACVFPIVDQLNVYLNFRNMYMSLPWIFMLISI